MTSLTRDPLLAVAKGLLLFLMGALILGFVACLVAIPGVLLARRAIVVEISDALHGIDPTIFVWAIAGLLLLAALLVALLWKVLQLLKRIVDTVGEGDPFVPVNASRLTAMAWLVLAIQAVSLPLAAIGTWLSRYGDDPHARINVDVGLSGNGLLLMLVLFILARVFRQGAAMRDELEATV